VKTKACILIGFMLLGTTQAFSQYSDFKYKKRNHSSDSWFLNSTKESRYFAGGIGLNLFNYFGDLTPKDKFIKNAFKVTRPGASLFGTYHLANLFGIKGEIIYGRITGDDFNITPYASGSSTRKYVRNLSFKNDLIGLSLQGYMNILSDPFEYYKRRDYNIYLMAGISMYYSNPKGKLDENMESPNAKRWVALRPLGTEGQNHPNIGGKYNAVQFGIPFGLCARIKLSYRLDLNIEASLTYLLSDYIDDVGGSYVDLGALDTDLARAMSDRSQEQIAVMKNELRDMDVINDFTNYIEYTSIYDGNNYRVLEGFGNSGDVRGGGRHDIIAITSFKISYIFTK